MKRFIIFLLFCIAFSACRKYEKEQITPDVLHVGTNVNLYGIEFSNDNIGYAVGGVRNEFGYIFKTTDGGETWVKTELEGDLCAYSIHFMNDSTGWIGSDFAHLYRTDNGGQSWLPVWFKPEELAFHEAHRTAIRQIQYLGDSTLVFVGGENYQIGNAYYSDDLGQNWSFDTLDHELHSLSYFNKEVGFVAGYGHLAKTTNGGQNFQLIGFNGDYFTGIAMLSLSEVVCVGNNGGIYKSTDGGSSWKTILNPNGTFGKRRAFNKLKFVDSNTGFAVGQYGLIMKTIDGGNSWTLLETSEDAHLNDLHFTNGWVYIAANSGKILSFSVY